MQTIALTRNRPKTISGYATSPPKPSDSFPRQPPESQRQRTTIFARGAAGLDAEGVPRRKIQICAPHLISALCLVAVQIRRLRALSGAG